MPYTNSPSVTLEDCWTAHWFRCLKLIEIMVIKTCNEIPFLTLLHSNFTPAESCFNSSNLNYLKAKVKPLLLPSPFEVRYRKLHKRELKLKIIKIQTLTPSTPLQLCILPCIIPEIYWKKEIQTRNLLFANTTSSLLIHIIRPEMDLIIEFL